MYWAADMADRREHGCIAASVSRDLLHWQEVGPVLVRRESDLEANACRPESPCVVERDGRCFLFYRHGNGTKFAVSDDPLDFHGRDSYLLSTAHAAKVVQLGGEWYLTNCSRPPGDITHEQDRTQGLYLARLTWDKGWPRVL